jgi:hypothetical protein
MEALAREAPIWKMVTDTINLVTGTVFPNVQTFDSLARVTGTLALTGSLHLENGD